MAHQMFYARYLLLAAVVVAFALTARSPNASATVVIASARSSWTYDPRTKLYTYTYAVTNAINSPNHMRTFAIRPTARALECLSPPGWRCYRGWMGDSTVTAWAAVDVGQAPPNWDRQLFVAPVHIAPGETLAGFQVISDREPDSSAQFVAQGFDTIPTGAHSPNPPPMNPTIWEEGFRGPAVVPRLEPGGKR